MSLPYGKDFFIAKIEYTKLISVAFCKCQLKMSASPNLHFNNTIYNLY